MASSTVSLGGFVFAGHEVPDKINFGGRMRLAKHVLIGGRRVTDAMGYEPADPKWDGRFRGASAASRARSVEAMARAGAQIPLSWGGFYKLVVIEDFDADYRRVNDVPYRIQCYVVDDENSGSGAGAGIDALIGGDLGSLVGLTLSGGVGSAIAGLSGAVGAVPSLTNAALSVTLPIQAAATGAILGLDSAIAAGDSTITALSAPDPALLAGPGFAAALTGSLGALQAQDALLQARGLAGRIAVNLNTLSG